ncbi:helix-turn-helix domain-containing protein [Brevundimonas faecalis]|uniref:DNA-binding CsgD family transcriptional regulator n=1 Tax=Brevundimonas faecalis TaxID=947378 RepID=A0ABV2RD54_9CAUL
MPAHASSGIGARLTPTERECLSLVGQGYQSKEIAGFTGKSPKTIDKHIENACRKLGVQNRRQAARLLTSSDIRSDVVEAPFPVADPTAFATDDLAKGGVNAADARTSPFPDLGRGGGDIRRAGGDERAERSGAQPAVDDATGGRDAFSARLDARDFLHRARSPLRERSTAEEARRGESASPLKRMMSILVIAVVASVLLAALLGGGVQLQLAVQAVDRLFSGR